MPCMHRRRSSCTATCILLRTLLYDGRNIATPNLSTPHTHFNTHDPTISVWREHFTPPTLPPNQPSLCFVFSIPFPGFHSNKPLQLAASTSYAHNGVLILASTSSHPPLPYTTALHSLAKSAPSRFEAVMMMRDNDATAASPKCTAAL